MKTLLRNLIGYNQDEWVIRIVQKSEELVRKSNGFWLEFSENVNTCKEKHALRQLYFIAHVVRKKTILAASCLYGDGDKACYNEQVLNVLKKMKEKFCAIVYARVDHRTKIVRAEKEYEYLMYL